MVANRRIKRLLSERRSLMRALSVHRLHPLTIILLTHYNNLSLGLYIVYSGKYTVVSKLSDCPNCKEYEIDCICFEKFETLSELIEQEES